MADTVGWIKLFRETQNNWVWDDKPFSKGQAWIDLLILAKRTDGKFMSGNRVVHGKRGCVYKSMLYLSDRGGWDRKKTKSFLNALEADKMVTVKATTHGTTIRIEKYDVFQGKGSTREQQKDSGGTTGGQPEGSNLPIYKKIRKNTSYSKEDEEGGAASGAEAPSSAPREKSIYERMRE